VHLKHDSALVAALLTVVLSGPLHSQQNVRPDNVSGFELSISQTYDEASKPGIAVHASIPYRRLVFFVRGSRYEARYRVYLELKDKSGKLIQGEVWEESVATAEFKETTSGSMTARVSRTIPVAPGEYEAGVTVEVIGTSRRFSQTERVRVVGAGVERLELLEPVFFTQAGDSLSRKPRDGELGVALCSGAEDERANINAGAVYGDVNAWVRAAFNVVTPAAQAEAPLVVSARVRNSRGVVLLYARHTAERPADAHAVLCLDINVDSFVLGEYELSVVAETQDGAGKSESQGRFIVLFNRGLLDEHFADLLDLCALVMDKKDLQELRDAAPDKRLQVWTDLWRKRDTSPSTKLNEEYGEFLVRLKEVLTSFSRLQPGWKTDMGRTYLVSGRPDKIESQQDARGRYYQLWYYYTKGVVYVFEDAIGTGDYHLLTTEMI
jgi:GWxTD domain-containing protein